MRGLFLTITVWASFLFNATAQSIGINSTGSSPATSAMLDISSSNKGMLIPRVALSSISDNTTIASPAPSLLVFNTNNGITGGNGAGYYFWNSSQWVKLLSLSDVGVFSGWSLTGNAGTGNTNFVGTTDLQPVRFRINNQHFGAFMPGNIGLGLNVIPLATTGLDNLAIQNGALQSNTTGSRNIAIGTDALNQNQQGTDNIAIGKEAGRSGTTAAGNIAIGNGSLLQNTDRSELLAIGDSALMKNGTGVTFFEQAIENMAVGHSALLNNTTGSYNLAVGLNAMQQNSSGIRNTALGNQSMINNTVGVSNTAVGHDAMISNTTGARNVAVGQASFSSNISGGGTI